MHDRRQPGAAPPAGSTIGGRGGSRSWPLWRIGFGIGWVAVSPGLLLGGPLLGALTGGAHGLRLRRGGAVMARLETAANALGAVGEYQVTLPLQETVVTPPPPPPPPKAPLAQRVIQAGPAIAVPSVAAIKQIILSASKRYGVPYGRLLSVAECESGLNPLAVNRSSGATGLLLFMTDTFYGHGGTDLWSATQQANTAAQMFSIGESSEWVCK